MAVCEKARCGGGSADEIINLGTSVSENNLPEQKTRQGDVPLPPE
jgi:hypothetical protein